MQVINWIKRKLGVPFFMEVNILMCWSLWKERNNWIFDNIDPSVDNCRRKFRAELAMPMHRAKQKHKSRLQEWIDQIV